MNKLAWILSVLWVGCSAPSPLVQSARGGEHPRLQAEATRRLAEGTLGRREARAAALATLEHELEVTEGAEALRRVWEVEACAEPAASALRIAAKRRDEAAGQALVALYEAGALSRLSAREYASGNPHEQRVAVRALDRLADHEARVRYFGDSNGALRTMALRAAMLASDPRDVPALRERARLEPEPAARANAIRALALLDDPPEDLAAFLAELEPTLDEGARGDVAVAWALSPTFERGGRERLLRKLSAQGVVSQETAVVALLVLRTRVAETGLRQLAERVVVRGLAEADEPTRRLLLRGVPLADGAITQAVGELAAHGSSQLQIEAAARLLANPKGTAAERQKLTAELFTRASRAGVLGSQARLALAQQHDPRVQGWLEQDLLAPEPARRLLALRGLVALGVAGRAATLLAAPEPSIRTRTACAILGAAD